MQIGRQVGRIVVHVGRQVDRWVGTRELDKVLSRHVDKFPCSSESIFFCLEVRTVEELCDLMEAQPTTVRRHLSYWVSQGVLHENPTDTFTIVENINEADTVLTGE